MNNAHWHLVLNHLPIIIPLLGVLVMIGGFITRSDIVKRTAYFIFVLGAICAYPSLATGEGAEEVIENLAGIDEKIIHVHEEVAEIFAILSYILGAFSLIGIWANYYRKSFANIISILTILFSFIVLFYARQTGTTGGEIRHTEIRAAGSTFIPPAEKGESD